MPAQSPDQPAKRGPAKPSVLVRRIQKLFPKISPRTYTPRETVYTALAEENLFRDLSLALNQKLEGLPISPAWRETGHGPYAEAARDYVLDWIRAHPSPEGGGATGGLQK